MPIAPSPGVRWALILSIVLASLVSVRAARAGARLKTCVTVAASSPDRESSLQLLVEAELDQHPSHHAVRSDCESYLRVEWIDAGSAGSWLTARINTQVPYRVEVSEKGLSDAVRRLLIVVLHNDPILLRGPRAENWASKSLDDLRRRSLMYFGFELFQTGFVLDRRFMGLPGVALTGRREIDALYVGLRVAGAYDPTRRSDGLYMTSLFDASIDLAFDSAPLGNTSLFAGFGVGLAHQRFRGPSPYYPPTVSRTASQTGAELALFGGIETLRVTDTRLTLFARLGVPAFVSKDRDDAVVDSWVPTATIGIGLAF